MQLKVLSFNIHKGLAWHARKSSLEIMREMLRETDADLVFLQEVHGKNELHTERMNAEYESQYEFLADQVWTHFCYAKNAIYDHGHHGNVILSKYPILTFHHENISTNVLEQRGILSAQIDLQPAGKILNAYCVHLNLLHSGRLSQYTSILNKLNKEADPLMPLILAGDFNDWNQKAGETFESLLELSECYKFLNGNYAKTFPSLFPMLALDRIYTKNVKITGAKTLHSYAWASDHLPLMATIEV